MSPQSATFFRGNEQLIYTRWETIPRALKAEEGQWVYLGPNGSRWDLYGRHAGRQGVRLVQEMSGAWHLPFEHLFTESAYQVGATYERSNINKRLINFGVALGGPQYTSQAYRAIEANWWDAWPHDTPGWLGRCTRFSGWRWTQVQLAKQVDTTVKMDPVAYQNNVMQWDMQIVAPKPWYAKRTLVESWKPNTSAVSSGGVSGVFPDDAGVYPSTLFSPSNIVSPGRGFDENIFVMANRGQLPAWPLFLYSGPGRAWIQDGMTTRMVELPLLSEDDGYVLVDTDPANRTLTGSTDPIDNIFFDIIRSSRILDFFLHDIAALGLPVWRRANNIRFTSQIPPRTVANLKVRHDNANGSITMLLPQRYIRPS